MSDDTKPLPEPMLTEISDVIRIALSACSELKNFSRNGAQTKAGIRHKHCMFVWELGQLMETTSSISSKNISLVLWSMACNNSGCLKQNDLHRYSYGCTCWNIISMIFSKFCIRLLRKSFLWHNAKEKQFYCYYQWLKLKFSLTHLGNSFLI